MPHGYAEQLEYPDPVITVICKTRENARFARPETGKISKKSLPLIVIADTVKVLEGSICAFFIWIRRNT